MNQKSYIWGVAHPERKIIIPLCSASVGPHNLGRKEENNVRSREKDPLSDHHAVFGLTLTKSGKIVWTERFLILKERTLFTIGRKRAETIEKELYKGKKYKILIKLTFFYLSVFLSQLGEKGGSYMSWANYRSWIEDHYSNYAVTKTKQ